MMTPENRARLDKLQEANSLLGQTAVVFGVPDDDMTEDDLRWCLRLLGHRYYYPSDRIRPRSIEST